ncbi:MAG: ABC transporter substrate-binding protein, partial [Rhodospirillales bacterium]|nr:ABC transporter substrate-binding protein [Rhodospirillales bacterium]
MMVRPALFLRAAAAALALSLCLSSASSADPAGNAKDFVKSLADQAIQALAVTDISRSERIDRFRVLFNDHFAVKTIGQWVLGRYWRRAKPA